MNDCCTTHRRMLNYVSDGLHSVGLSCSDATRHSISNPRIHPTGRVLQSIDLTCVGSAKRGCSSICLWCCTVFRYFSGKFPCRYEPGSGYQCVSTKYDTVAKNSKKSPSQHISKSYSHRTSIARDEAAVEKKEYGHTTERGRRCHSRRPEYKEWRQNPQCQWLACTVQSR